LAMTDKSVKIRENKDRGEHGYFAKGNTIGRMKKKGYTINDLTKVAIEYEKTHDNTILKHYIEQLFKNDKLLDKFVDRYIPPVLKQQVDIDGKIDMTTKLLYEKFDKLTLEQLDMVQQLTTEELGKFVDSIRRKST